MSLKDVYMKERRRVQSFLRRAKKRNYIFPDNILPEIPKKITDASIRRLKKLTPKELYKKAYGWVEATTGELKSAARGLIEARKRGRKKAELTLNRITESEAEAPSGQMLPLESDFTDTIITNFMADVEGLPTPLSYMENNKKELLSYLRDRVKRDRGNFAQILQKNSLELQTLIESYIYTSDDAVSGEIFDKIVYLLE